MTRKLSRFVNRFSVALFLASMPVAAIAAQDADPAVQADIPAAPASLEDRALTLAPGEYLWEAQAGSDAPVAVVVSIASQRAMVFQGRTLVGVSTVSTGKAGHDTPAGRFTILQKAARHRSNLYDAPMPYMQRLTWDGVALHAGNIPGYPASHGCVRLPAAFAQKLFAATRMGAVVIVDEGDFTAADALASLDGEAQGGDDVYLASAATSVVSPTAAPVAAP